LADQALGATLAARTTCGTSATTTSRVDVGHRHGGLGSRGWLGARQPRVPRRSNRSGRSLPGRRRPSSLVTVRPRHSSRGVSIDCDASGQLAQATRRAPRRLRRLRVPNGTSACAPRPAAPGAAPPSGAAL